MPSKDAPLARVLVRVDAVTAARAEAAGYKVDRDTGKSFPAVTIPCAATDRLACIAADHADASEYFGEVVIDLREGPRKFVDESPPVAPDVPGPSRSPLWEMPSIGARYHGPVHLPADADVADLALEVERWLGTVPPLETAAFEAAQKRWREQAERMLYVATTAVGALPSSISLEERYSVQKKLASLADHVRHPQDGGPYFDDQEYVETPWRTHELKPAHEFVNEAYRAAIESCERLTTSGDDRARSDQVQDELEGLAWQLRDQLPPRIAKARQLGLLGSSVAAARDELFPIAWAGWRRLADDETLRDVVNPTLEVLTEFEEERERDRQDRAWPHDEINLRWLTSSKEPVLTSSFLGTMIVRRPLATEVSE